MEQKFKTWLFHKNKFTNSTKLNNYLLTIINILFNKITETIKHLKCIDNLIVNWWGGGEIFQYQVEIFILYK